MVSSFNKALHTTVSVSEAWTATSDLGWRMLCFCRLRAKTERERRRERQA